MAPAKPTVYYYHDGRHPLIYMYEPPIAQEQYEHCVDELVGNCRSSCCIGGSADPAVPSRDSGG